MAYADDTFDATNVQTGYNSQPATTGTDIIGPSLRFDISNLTFPFDFTTEAYEFDCIGSVSGTCDTTIAHTQNNCGNPPFLPGTCYVVFDNGSFISTHGYPPSGNYYIRMNFVTNTSNFFIWSRNPYSMVFPSPAVVGSISVTPNPIQTNTSTTASASFTYADTTDTHTATWNWGDGNTTTGTVTETNGSGSVSDSHTYSAADVYTVTLTVTDIAGASSSSTFQYVSVYNPTSQGLFSAGQKYTSPAGAYTANTSLTGTVKFGLSYKYQGTMPTGDRQFTMNFNAANLTFNATTISSLVISNGIGTLTGTGTINSGSTTYNFLVTGSESANTIRVQITDPSNNNVVIYDTQPGDPATATPTTSVTGNVIVHN